MGVIRLLNRLRGRNGWGGTSTLYKRFDGSVWCKDVQWDKNGRTTLKSKIKTLRTEV